ncbi:hypothetical protein BSKO_04724 [Bryopsis sp. KO-2023]|nr:hypothetical protein BSKO_04724 [Bryopsis sp. KO-2023]
MLAVLNVEENHFHISFEVAGLQGKWVRYVEDVAGDRLKHLVMQENGNDMSGKYVAIVEHGGQRYGFDLDRFENAVAKYSRGTVVQATEIVSKQTIQTHDGSSGHPLAEIFSEHGDLSSKGRLVQDEGGVDSKTVLTTVSLAGPSGEREMAVVKHADKTCYVPLHIMEQYEDPKQLATKAIVSKHNGKFVPNPEQQVRWTMCGDGRDICYNVTKIAIPGDFGETTFDVAIVLHDNVHCYADVPAFENCGLRMGLSDVLEKHGTSNPRSIVPNVDGTADSPGSTPLGKRVVANEAEGKVACIIRIRRRQVATVQHEIELGTFESSIRQQPVLFLIEEHGKLVQEISPHLDPTKLRYLAEECSDEDGVNRVEKVVISTGKDDHELELEKLETLVSHMPLEETASKHGAVWAKSRKNLPLTREVDKGEKTLTSPSGHDIVVIVRERVLFEEASQETEEIKRRMRGKRLEIENVSGVEYEVRPDVLEGRLAMMEIDGIARQFGIATLRKSEHSQEEGGDVQECQGAKKRRNKSRRRKKFLIGVEDVILEIELGSWESAIQTMLAEIVAKAGTVRHRLGGDDDIEEVDEVEEEEVASKRTAYRVEGTRSKCEQNAQMFLLGKMHSKVAPNALNRSVASDFVTSVPSFTKFISFKEEERRVIVCPPPPDEQGKRQETVATVEFEIDECGVELQTCKIAIDSMPSEDPIEKYGKLCGRTGQCTLEITPAKHHFTAAGSSSVGAAKVATVIVKSKKKAKKAKKDKPRGNAAKVWDLMDTDQIILVGRSSTTAIDDRRLTMRRVVVGDPGNVVDVGHTTCAGESKIAKTRKLVSSSTKKSIPKRPPFVVGAKRNPGFPGKAP